MNDPSAGKPADFGHRIVARRVRLVRQIEGFIGKELDLVDVGCGNGASMLSLAPMMHSCVGLELSEANKAPFEERRAKTNIRNCELRIFDIERETLGRTFDRLISFELIEHLRNERSVSFLHDLLRPGGLAAISVPNKWWVFETHGARLPLLPWNRVPFFSWLPRPLHDRFAKARIYTRGRISRLLESVGFTILSVAYIAAPFDVLKDGVPKRLLAEFIFTRDTTSNPLFSTALFVVARRD